MNQRLPTLDYATPACGPQRQLAMIRFVAVVFAAIALIGLLLLCVSAKSNSGPPLFMTLFGTFGNGVSFAFLLRQKYRAQ